MELTDEQKLNAIIKTQADITCYEVANFCAMICDKHRGHLQIGDMIRQHFGLAELKDFIPDTLNNKPKQEDVNFENAPVKKKNHLVRVK